MFGIQLPDIDSIVPPPPSPLLITGSDTCCLNDICNYSADLPIDCNAQWFVDDILQGSDSSVMEIVWDTPGEHEIRLNSFCDNNSSPLDTMIVLVNDVPDLPAIIYGENEPCLNSTEIYTTIVADGETCQWKIDEIIQTDTLDFIEILWDEPGTHMIEVRAVNQCGIGEPQSLDILVFEIPIVNLGNDTTIIQGHSLILDAENPGSNFLRNTSDTTQSIVVIESNIYWVEVSNTCGMDSDTVVVDVIVGIKPEQTQNEPTIYFENNLLKIDIPGEQINKIQVFNLKGNLLNESKNQNSITLSQNGVCILLIQTDKRRFIKKFHFK